MSLYHFPSALDSRTHKIVKLYLFANKIRSQKQELKVSCGVLHYLLPDPKFGEGDSQTSKPLSQLGNFSRSHSKGLNPDILELLTRPQYRNTGNNIFMKSQRKASSAPLPHPSYDLFPVKYGPFHLRHSASFSFTLLDLLSYNFMLHTGFRN